MNTNKSNIFTLLFAFIEEKQTDDGNFQNVRFKTLFG